MLTFRVTLGWGPALTSGDAEGGAGAEQGFWGHRDSGVDRVCPWRGKAGCWDDASWEWLPTPTLTQAGHSLGGAPSGKAVPVMGRKSLFWHRTLHFRSRSWPLARPQGRLHSESRPVGPAQAQGASPWGSLSLPSGKQLTMPSFRGGGGRGSTEGL